MFFPCKQFDKVELEKMFTSQICILFYFFAREKPKSTSIQPILSLTRMSTRMKHSCNTFLKLFLATITNWEAKSQTKKVIGIRLPSQAGEGSRYHVKDPSPYQVWENITFNKTIPSCYQKSVILVYLKAALHRQIDFSSGLHLMPMHHRRFWKE